MRSLKKAHARAPEDTQHQALMQTAKDSITQLHSGSSKENNHYCLGSLHRLGSVCCTYGQPDDSQYVLLATLSRAFTNVFSGSTQLARKQRHQSVRQLQIHVTGGL